MPIVELTGFAILALAFFLVAILIRNKRRPVLPSQEGTKALPPPEPVHSKGGLPESPAAQDLSAETDEGDHKEKGADGEILPAMPEPAPRNEVQRTAAIEPQCFEKTREFSGEPAPESVNVKKMVWISPGSFTLGSPSEEPGRSRSEGPRTRVFLTHGFWMAECPVTQREYSEVMNVNPSYFTGELQRPVESVTWEQALLYCKRRTQLEKQNQRIPEDYNYRLPTEAEWEYAARAGNDTLFSYGEDPQHKELDRYAWFYSNSGNPENETNGAFRRTTHAVGQKQPNPWGLYDIHGNVWEWCLDNWSAFYPGGTLNNPEGPGNGAFRVRRGGSWISQAQDCRSAARGVLHPSSSHPVLGFRVVLAIQNIRIS